jgi:hypothetical protein
MVFSVLGVVLLMLIVAVLLRDVRGLQAAMANVVQPLRTRVPAFASRTDPPGDTFVLAVSTHCPACEARALALARAASERTGRIVLLSADATPAAWVDGAAVEVIADPVLLGELRVDVTPMLLRYDPDGGERFRKPVGSDNDLRRLLDLEPARQTVS